MNNCNQDLISLLSYTSSDTGNQRERQSHTIRAQIQTCPDFKWRKVGQFSMKCYATPRPLWTESRKLWHFIEPSFAFGASFSHFFPHCSLFSFPFRKRACQRDCNNLRIISGLRVKIPIFKNCGRALKRGKTRFEGDKWHLETLQWGSEIRPFEIRTF